MDYIRSYVCRDWYCERSGKIEFNVLVVYSTYTMFVVGYCRWNVCCYSISRFNGVLYIILVYTVNLYTYILVNRNVTLCVCVWCWVNGAIESIFVELELNKLTACCMVIFLKWNANERYLIFKPVRSESLIPEKVS